MRNSIKYSLLTGAILTLSLTSTLVEASPTGHIALIHIVTAKASFALILMVFLIVGYALWSRREKDFVGQKPYYRGALDQCSWIAVPALAMFLGLVITDNAKSVPYRTSDLAQQTALMIHSPSQNTRLNKL